MSDYLKNYLQAINNPLPALKKTFLAELDFLKKTVGGRASLLDVGCGAGRPAVDVAAFAGQIVGIDKDSRMLDLANERLGNLKNVRFVKDDALNMSFTAKTFDVSFSTYNLIGTFKKSERQRAVNEMTRVTKPNGKVVTITWKRDKTATDFLKEYYPSIGIEVFEIDKDKSITSKGTFERLSEKELAEYYKKAGLQDLSFEEIGPVWYAVVGTKKPGSFDDLV